jgi:hypothetical protein
MPKPLALPDTPAGRIELVGKTLFGEDWHVATAAALGVHRGTLWRWMSDRTKNVRMRDVDHHLLDLLEVERERTHARSAQIAALQKLFIHKISDGGAHVA